MVKITFFGNACFAIETAEASLLIDPHITDSHECPYTLKEVLDQLDGPDCVCVTHAAEDHLGDAPELALKYDVPVLTEPGTAEYLRAEGVENDSITKVVWGMQATVGEMTVRPLEAHHGSFTQVNGNLVTGLALSFMVSVAGISIYHLGDTAISSDLKLYGELYEPDVILIGVGRAFNETFEPDETVTRNIAELSTDEAVRITEWLNPNYVVPMHFEPGEREAFLEALADADLPTQPVSLNIGESVTVE